MTLQVLLKLVLFKLSSVLSWIPYLGYIKGTLTSLLVIPYFSGGFFVYSNVVKPCLYESLISKLESSSNGEGFIEREIHIYDQEETVPITFFEPEERKEWSCSLCLISTTSESSLKEHLNGEKHKQKLREYERGKSQLRSSESGFLNNLINNEIWGEILHPKQHPILLKWEKPGIGWTKLNTDGSVVKTRAGIGGILRDCKGEPILAFVERIYDYDIFMAEMLAVWRGLVLARSLGVEAVWVESDSKSVVNTINKEQPYSGGGEECLKQIWKLLGKFQRYQVTHLFREANRAADYLASMVTEELDVVLWPRQFPRVLWKIIKEDSNGKVYYRKRRYSFPWNLAYITNG